MPISKVFANFKKVCPWNHFVNYPKIYSDYENDDFSQVYKTYLKSCLRRVVLSFFVVINLHALRKSKVLIPITYISRPTRNCHFLQCLWLKEMPILEWPSLPRLWLTYSYGCRGGWCWFPLDLISSCCFLLCLLSLHTPSHKIANNPSQLYQGFPECVVNSVSFPY